MVGGSAGKMSESSYQRISAAAAFDARRGDPILSPSALNECINHSPSWCFHVLLLVRPGCYVYRFASISTSYSTSPFSSCTNERRTRVSPAPKETRPIFLSPTTKSQLKGKKRQGGRERIIVASSHPTPAKASQGLVWTTLRNNKNPSRNLPPHITSFHPKAKCPLHTLSR